MYSLVDVSALSGYAVVQSYLQGDEEASDSFVVREEPPKAEMA